MSMSIAGLVLACMLEVECVEGRNPMRFLESLITSLECDDTPTVTGSTPAAKAKRAFFASLDPKTTGVKGRLKEVFKVTDMLIEATNSAPGDEYAGVGVLAFMARAGRAWSVTQAAAVDLPELPEQIPDLLDQIKDGELIDVSGMENAAAKKWLVRLMQSLNLDERRNEDGAGGYGLPEVREEGLHSKAALTALTKALRVSRTNPISGPVEVLTMEKDEEIEEDAPAPPPPRKATQGPAMPSAAQLKAASAAMQSGMMDLMDREEDDDDDGPLPVNVDSSIAPDIEESQETMDRKRKQRSAEWDAVRSGGSVKNVKTEHQGGREEWMLVPPKDGGVLSGLKAQPAQRGFQQMVPHSKAWAGLGEDENEGREQVNPEIEAVLKEHKEKRGPSLVEQHQQSLAQKGKKPKAGRVAGGGSSFSWDHEDMMGGSRRMTTHEVNGMIEKSRDLDSRFSRSVTKNFM